MSAESYDQDPPKRDTSDNHIVRIPSSPPQQGYPGQGLDDLITSGIQWIGSLITGSDVSEETSGNIQLATTLAIVIVSKGKNVKAVEAVKSADNAKSLLKQGRAGKQERLTELMTDSKVSKADRGWLKQEKNQIDRGKRTSMRNPPGKDLAHERGREAAKGYSYKNSNLQNRKDHRNQHKYDNFGKKNKERPIQ
ncbi:hypothetical protein HX004_08350 [Myroides sp. 1354]|uniref:polymorphic toxin type 8 domain-containing protein n=1 Tax=unclassified Myroides TaxID=2642485 RepID=UPI00258146FF|nr:hypothetical protein [Myroides sp. R163-1]MDM1055784.1 hypothetical protein [Myroides sp. 1354]MDM1069965.1 hypothetical protein [Myroides sp. 1372]